MDTTVTFRGWTFCPPFRCMCCGKEIGARQFAFGRACGPCDVGMCNVYNQAYQEDHAHDLPSWWRSTGAETLEAFAKETGACLERA